MSKRKLFGGMRQNGGQNILEEARADLNTIDFNKVKNLTFVDLCQDKEGPPTYGSVTTFKLLKEMSENKQSIKQLLTAICVDDKSRSIIHGKRRGKALAAMGTNVKPTSMKDILEEFNTSPDVTETDKEELFTQWQTWVVNKFILGTPETWSTEKHVYDISNGEGTAYWLYKDGDKNQPMKKDDCDIKDTSTKPATLIKWHLKPILEE